MSSDSVHFWRIKDEIRVVGFDDGPFLKHKSRKTVLVGSVFRGGLWLDGMLITEITVDGMDATDRVISLINSSRHRGQLRVIMFDGVTVGGFNPVDIQRIYKETGLPVIVVTRKLPDMSAIKEGLHHLDNWEERWNIIKKAGQLFPVDVKPGARIYIQIAGINVDDAREIVRITSTRSHIPEPLRVSHLVASAIIEGESHGGA